MPRGSGRRHRRRCESLRARKSLRLLLVGPISISSTSASAPPLRGSGESSWSRVDGHRPQIMSILSTPRARWSLPPVRSWCRSVLSMGPPRPSRRRPEDVCCRSRRIVCDENGCRWCPARLATPAPARSWVVDLVVLAVARPPSGSVRAAPLDHEVLDHRERSPVVVAVRDSWDVVPVLGASSSKLDLDRPGGVIGPYISGSSSGARRPASFSVPFDTSPARSLGTSR